MPNNGPTIGSISGDKDQENDNRVCITFELDQPIEKFNKKKNRFVQDIAKFLRVNPKKVELVSVTKGGVIPGNHLKRNDR